MEGVVFFLDMVIRAFLMLFTLVGLFLYCFVLISVCESVCSVCKSVCGVCI